MLGRLSLVKLDTTVYWFSYSVGYLLDLRPFQIVFFEGAHQFWASVAKEVGGWEAEGGGVGWEVAKACEKCPE